MKRWEQFNEMCGCDDTLETQTAEIYAEKIKDQSEGIDKQGLYNAIKNWLAEEVGV